MTETLNTKISRAYLKKSKLGLLFFQIIKERGVPLLYQALKSETVEPILDFPEQLKETFKAVSESGLNLKKDIQNHGFRHVSSSLANNLAKSTVEQALYSLQSLRSFSSNLRSWQFNLQRHYEKLPSQEEKNALLFHAILYLASFSLGVYTGRKLPAAKLKKLKLKKPKAFVTRHLIPTTSLRVTSSWLKLVLVELNEELNQNAKIDPADREVLETLSNLAKLFSHGIAYGKN